MGLSEGEQDLVHSCFFGSVLMNIFSSLDSQGVRDLSFSHVL